MRGRTVAIVGVALVAASLAAVAAFWMKRHNPSPSQESRLVGLFGGEEGLRTVAQPAKVEAYRLKPDPQKEPGDYDVSFGPVLMPKDVATEVSRALVTSSSYWWEVGKPCKPQYGVRLSFHRDQDQVDVFLCYECMELRVARNGKMTSGPGQDKSFDHINGLLVAAAKTLFPDDPEIKELRAINWEKPE